MQPNLLPRILADRINSGQTQDGQRWCSDHKDFITAMWVKEFGDTPAYQDCYHCIMEKIPFDKRVPRKKNGCEMSWCINEADAECPHCGSRVCHNHYNLYNMEVVCHKCLSKSDAL